MRILYVCLKHNRYPVLIKNNLLSELDRQFERLKLGGRVLIISNLNLQQYAGRVAFQVRQTGRKAEIIYVPDGETAKTLDQAERVYDCAFGAGLDRSSAIIAVGGGVVGDLAGFAAATYMRGIDFVQIPTTLLAQVDSSIGGKTAVNHQKGKNIIGAFYQPKAVFIDPTVLKTLPARELSAGMAEVIKYGIACDSDFFSLLESSMDKAMSLELDILKDIIEWSCRIKTAIVQEDEKERNIRAVLNFGHTFGHALETLTDYRQYKHGEAVAVGMVMAARLACLRRMFGWQEAERISSLLVKAGLPIKLTGMTRAESVIEQMGSDKKNTGGRLTLILPRKLGRVVIDKRPVEQNLLLEAVQGCCKTE